MTGTRRFAAVIELQGDSVDAYRELHAEVWPEVIACLRAQNITNYSIYLKEPEHLLFSYFEYVGTDFIADTAAAARVPVMQKWAALCSPMQIPFESRNPGDWWALMEEVFHMD